MFINPVVVGVVGTLIVEALAIFAYAIYTANKKK